MKQGQNVAAKAIEVGLRQVLPEGIDHRAIAEDLAERVQMAAVAEINHREGALQQALAATMEYLGSVNRSTYEQVVALQGEVRSLKVKLAAIELAGRAQHEGGDR